MTQFFKSNPDFDMSIFKNKDIIHDPNIKFFEHENEESYVIENFISEDERKSLYNFFTSEYNNSGENINDNILHIIHPIRYKLIQEILLDKLKKYFGDDIVFYSDVSNDPISVSDQFFKISNPYQLHTDCVTHISGYKPYKDVIIPIEIHKDAEVFYYTCNQRYKARASQFQYKWHNNYFPNYSNILRMKPYADYGVEDVEYNEISDEWINKHIPSYVPKSVFNGLSIEHTFPWIPRNAIVQDSSVLHGSSDFRQKGVEWKVGLTFHLLKKDDTYGSEVEGNYYTKFSRYTQPLISVDSFD